MEAARYPNQRQHCRVSFPVLVSFSSDSLSVRDFTLNLSEGGIFLPTDKPCPLGTRGMLKFRTSQFEDPFSLEAEVVRLVPPGDESGEQVAGLGMRFVDLNEKHRALLLKLINGASSGSIVQTIRNSLKEHGRTLGAELRKRPTDQKMMLAWLRSRSTIRLTRSMIAVRYRVSLLTDRSRPWLSTFASSIT
jgi:uncharacterized protein (TIGR02266 family)